VQHGVIRENIWFGNWKENNQIVDDVILLTFLLVSYLKDKRDSWGGSVTIDGMFGYCVLRRVKKKKCFGIVPFIYCITMIISLYCRSKHTQAPDSDIKITLEDGSWIGELFFLFYSYLNKYFL
jgi:hypothetical protein